MVKYNTSEKQLILPEYGRNMQRMVDHCLTIEDREERTKCATTIASIMSKLFPEEYSNDENQKVWDHLNIMSGFKLDIDFPCEVLTEDKMNPHPKKIPYTKTPEKFKHYGKNIIEMILNVSEMENCLEKDKLIFLIANQMKKLLVTQNPECASDLKVFNDILEISRGKITIDAENYRLNEYIGVQGNQDGKKKKKK